MSTATTSSKPSAFTIAMQMLQAAIREGRHSQTVRVVCQLCREWCDGYYHVTLDHKRICKSCAAKMNAVPKPQTNHGDTEARR